jgi:uncharacterized protein (TIGR02270 family)
MQAAPVIPGVVAQHAEQAAFLWQLRTRGTTAPNFAVRFLDRFDRRLAAYLDGIATAGPGGAAACAALLESPDGGAVFASTQRALEDRDERRLDEILAVAFAIPACLPGAYSAFGWTEPVALRAVVASLLASSEPHRRSLGIAACGLHGVSPGSILSTALRDGEPRVRLRAVKTIGQLGNTSFDDLLLQHLSDSDEQVRRASAYSAVLLGQRSVALRVLTEAAASARMPFPREALLVMQVSNVEEGASVLTAVLGAQSVRHRLTAAGALGDSSLIPALLNAMEDPRTSRVAGEAFTTITGCDLAVSGLDGRRPENFESGPNDDPNDPNVDMDPDDGLPWPDVKKVEAWWRANEHRFQKRTRYFMGQPVTKEHCIHVLKTGYQRQRILAAQYLCLLEPGTPLFNTAAPAWRQQRLLAAM